MKKAIAAIAVAVLALASAFAGLKIGATLTTKNNIPQDTKGNVYSFDIAERAYWLQAPSAGSFGFTMVSDFTLSVTGGNFHESQPIHADVGTSLLPGIVYSVSDRMNITILAGAKYTRIGYHGEHENADAWDKILNIATIGLLGANPVRKLDTIFEVGIRFRTMGFGAQFAYPVMQRGVTDFKDGFSASFYTVFKL